ncbi:MAG: hypothetical protein AB1847_18445 [bacterium]
MKLRCAPIVVAVIFSMFLAGWEIHWNLKDQRELEKVRTKLERVQTELENCQQGAIMASKQKGDELLSHD